MNEFEKCNLCPRKCGVDRYVRYGYCGAGAETVLAYAGLHQWEEPCISVKNGAGAVFFSGCNLRCKFCQNHDVSTGIIGKSVTNEKLASVFLSLRKKGADNIDLVTPTHFVPNIKSALEIAKPVLDIPVIYNCGGYELTDTIKSLDGYIDIYMPDLKYFSGEVSGRYSGAENYFEYAFPAILEMVKQTGKLRYDENGKLLSGTIIRHLVLPNQRHDSMKILDKIAENIPSDSVLVSIMSQYTPFDFIPDEYSEIKRRITKMEYNSVVNHAAELGLNGFTQQKSSASETYVPNFDLSGID